MNTNIKLSNGNLSVYGFSCGYIEQYKLDLNNGFNYLMAEMYQEHGMYHVKLIDNRTRTTNGNRDNFIHEWEMFESLTQARKQYRQYIKEVNSRYALATA